MNEALRALHTNNAHQSAGQSQFAGPRIQVHLWSVVAAGAVAMNATVASTPVRSPDHPGPHHLLISSGEIREKVPSTVLMSLITCSSPALSSSSSLTANARRKFFGPNPGGNDSDGSGCQCNSGGRATHNRFAVERGAWKWRDGRGARTGHGWWVGIGDLVAKRGRIMGKDLIVHGIQIWVGSEVVTNDAVVTGEDRRKRNGWAQTQSLYCYSSSSSY